MKPIAFVGIALDDLRHFPAGARREAGHQLDRVQRGLEPDDWKPMANIGSGVREIRVRDGMGSFLTVAAGRQGESRLIDESVQTFASVWDALEETPEAAAHIGLLSELASQPCEVSWRTGN